MLCEIPFYSCQKPPIGGHYDIAVLYMKMHLSICISTYESHTRT